MLGRLGRMAYINTLPVDWGLVSSPLGFLVKIHSGTPTTLNRLLADGTLDVSPVSSVAALEHADEWLVFDHLCIGCNGDVGSVILDSDRPVERLDGELIAVTSDSASAVKLLEVLLQRRWKIEARLVPQDQPASARLLIGDAALKASLFSKAGFVYDLGRAWKEFTGQGFIFGLWCVRREFVLEHPEEARALYHLLATSYLIGRTNMPSVAARAAAVTGLPSSAIERYYPKLVYEPDEALWSGLALFRQLTGHVDTRLATFGLYDAMLVHCGTAGSLQYRFPMQGRP